MPCSAWFALTIIAFFVSSAHAGVDLSNGNFAKTTVDLTIRGTGFKIARTYNSRTSREGIFGHGWCSEIETTVRPNGSGGVDVIECGSGRVVRYGNENSAKTDVPKLVEQIIAKVRVSHPDGKRVKDLEKALSEDASLRDEFAGAYGVYPKPKVGAKFDATGEGSFKVTADGYERRLANGTTVRFDKSGRVERYELGAGDYVKLVWGDKGLEEIVSGDGSKISAKTNAFGRVESLKAPGGETTTYSYSETGDLTGVKSSATGTAAKSYSYDDKHNLTKLEEPGWSLELAYDKKRDLLEKLRDLRTACVDSYSYPSAGKNEVIAKLKKECKGEKPVDGEFRYSYSAATGPANQVSFRVGERKADVTYAGSFDRPLVISSDGAKIEYRYDKIGRLVSRRAPASESKYSYDGGSNRVSEVVVARPALKNQKRTTKFEYDRSGNVSKMIGATTGEVDYDQKGRLVRIKRAKEGDIFLSYSAKGEKPERVRIEGKGEIKISYDASGAIAGVTSAGGFDTAIVVAEDYANAIRRFEIASTARQEP